MGALEQFSHDIGNRPELVQGAGGNLSSKLGPVLRIKASGAWLADALAKEIFVDVGLAALRDAMAGDFDDGTLKAALAGFASGALRPSIETPLHALAPFKVVAHVHSVATIAWSVRKDAEARLAERLSGVDWAFAPYARPGAPLAKAVRDIYRRGPAPVLILANHGLVVAADTVNALRALLDDVERRLAVEPAPGHAPPASRAKAPDGYRWADDSEAAFLAFDPARLAVAAAGSLYPDHVVFLGPGLAVATDAAAAAMRPAPKAVAVPGMGILARTDLTSGERAMLDCLGLVLARLDPAAAVNYLSTEDERALTGWDAEAHRRALDAAAR